MCIRDRYQRRVRGALELSMQQHPAFTSDYQLRLFIQDSPHDVKQWDDDAQRMQDRIPDRMLHTMRRPIDVGSPYDYHCEPAAGGRPEICVEPMAERVRIHRELPKRHVPRDVVSAQLKSRHRQQEMYTAREKAAADIARLMTKHEAHKMPVHRYQRLQMPFPRSSASFDAREAYFKQRASICKHGSP
eukprot:TRINITY_DN2907_c0_g1_i2.p2 TRINITY_DN2907_c0_g1~~TRINITY_DN2907_c0_g1_i2.p2  ORF type:complete len:188 (+),score=35.64 TRINITY_DN2907_c0_g1_i2:145-708(+)